MPVKKHPQDAHPAVGLLDCVRETNNKRYEPITPDSIECRHCGFDRPWHALKANDFTGLSRDPYWQAIADAVASEPLVTFQDAAPVPRELPRMSKVDVGALRADIADIRARAQAEASSIVDDARKVADQVRSAQMAGAADLAAAIAAAVGDEVRSALASARPPAPTSTTPTGNPG